MKKYTNLLLPLLLFCAIIVTKIVYKINGNNKDNVGSTLPSDIEYKTVSLSSSDINEGELLLIQSPEEMLGSPSLVSTAPESAGNPYYIGTKALPKDRLTANTVYALNDMAKALYNDEKIRLLRGLRRGRRRSTRRLESNTRCARVCE